MVDRHRGNDGVEAPEVRQRLGEVVIDHLDPPLAGEALAGGRQHQLGEVDTDSARRWARGEDHGEQASVAGAEVEDAAYAAGDVVEQDALPLEAVRERIRALAIAPDPLGVVAPLLAVPAVHQCASRRIPMPFSPAAARTG